MEVVEAFIQIAGRFLDLAGVLVILIGFTLATVGLIVTAIQRKGTHGVYKSYRNNLARSILIGLEFLVAGDIIRSVAGDLTFNSVLILGIIVIIRSFLGMEFEMEIEGRWPWQRARRQVNGHKKTSEEPLL